MRKAGYDDFCRQMMSWPILNWANNVYAAAVRTPPALEPQRRGKEVKIAKYKPVAPNAKTATPRYKALLRPRKGILLSQPENLIDRHL